MLLFVILRNFAKDKVCVRCFVLAKMHDEMKDCQSTVNLSCNDAEMSFSVWKNTKTRSEDGFAYVSEEQITV